MIIPDNEKSESVRQEVAQPTSKVAQPADETNIESRLSALESSTEVLESKIDILIELNFQNNELSNNKTPKEDGLDRIRTGDLRRVNSPFNALAGPFPQSEVYDHIFSNPAYTNIQKYQNLANKGLAELELPFTKDELRSYTNARKLGLTKKSEDWIERASRTFWNFTNGIINKKSIDELLSTTLKNYQSESARGKTLTFAKGFLKYLTKTRLDSRYYAFDIFLDRPKNLKVRKNVTNRIITKEDIENILAYIRTARHEDRLGQVRAQHYVAFILFGAYTGQRSMATMMKLTVGQVRQALRMEKPVVHVQATQDKIRMEHYVPLHPEVVKVLQPLLDDRADDELLFRYHSLLMWLKREKIPLTHISGHFVLGDLRKFAEQYGDIIQWDQSNRAYIMTHGVSGIDWKHYKHPLPKNVYEIYMKCWKKVRFDV